MDPQDANDEGYEILNMVLKVDGIDEPFDNAWAAMATKFKLDRACLYEHNSAGRSVMKDELYLIGIGFNLQNKFWQPLDSLGMVLYELDKKLYRPNGSPCIVD